MTNVCVLIIDLHEGTIPVKFKVEASEWCTILKL